MEFLEKDLEQVIYDAPSNYIEENLDIRGKKYRQLKIGTYGIADLVFANIVRSVRVNDKDLTFLGGGLEITICELKKDKIGISAYFQALRYAKGIQKYLNARGFENYFFKIVLIGRQIDTTGSFIFLPDLFNNDEYYGEEIIFSRSIKNINLFTYNYGLNGLDFKLHDQYSIINNDF